MNTVTIQLPDSLHRCATEAAKRDRVSLEQLMTLALAEKLSAIEAQDYLEERAKRGDRAKFLAVMAKVPNVPPVPGDELTNAE